MMKVSVVIPCYNSAEVIGDAVRSCFEQTHSDIEVICIDNNSKDNTFSKLGELKKSYPDLKIDMEPTKGANYARNRGLGMASGEWVQFLDSDDVLRKEKFSSNLKVDDGECAIIVSDYEKLNVQTGEKIIIKADRDPWSGLMSNRLGITSANLFRRAALDRVGGWDIDLKSSQEYDLMFRLMQSGSVSYCEEVHTLLRSGFEGSISQSDILGNKHRYLDLMSRIAFFLRTELPERYAQIPDSWFQEQFIRIRLNAIDGFENSPLYYDRIMPKGFHPEPHEFSPAWFRMSCQLIGYKNTERLKKAFGK